MRESRGKSIDRDERPLAENSFPLLGKTSPEMAERELLYRTVFDQTFQMTGTLDSDGTLLQVNRTALNLIGVAEKDVLGRPFAETPWWSNAPIEQQKLREAIQTAAGGELVRFETRHYDARQREMVVDFSLKPAMDATGRVAFLIAEGRDITSYERASRKLTRLKNLYLALSSINEAILRHRDADSLLQEVCKIATGVDEVRMAWFGFVEPQGGVVRPSVWSGGVTPDIHEFFVDAAALDMMAAASHDNVEGEEAGGALVIDDLSRDPDAGRWAELLQNLGLRSLAAYPLLCRERICGIFVLYSDRAGLFQGDIGALFEKMAANVAYALDNLERERLRSESEHALRESEARYRELVENANTIILRISPDGLVTHYNEFAERFFGWSNAEVVGRPIWKTILPAEDELNGDLRDLFAKASDNPEAYRYHFNRNLCKDGSSVWIAWTNKVFTGRDGQVQEILSIGIDLTAQQQQADLLERKAREEEVRAELLRLSVEESTLPEFLEQSLAVLVKSPWLGVLPQGAIFLVGPSGNELTMQATVNLPEPVVEQCANILFGECLCGRAALEKQPLFVKSCRHKALAHAESPRAHVHHVLPLLAGHELLGVLTLYLPVEQAEDKVQESFLLNVADLLATVIAKKQAQAVLREHDSLLEQLIDSIPLPIFHKDAGLTYLGCNEAFAKEILGLPKQGIIGKTMYDIAPADLAEVYDEADLALLKSGGRQVYETEVMFTDGRRHPVIMHKAVLHNRSGSPSGIVGAILDLSEHKQLEDQLRHSQKVEALGTLTGGIAHDFNNLLTAIMGYASILQLKLPKNEPQVETVEQILATTERAAALTQSLLTYSRKKVANPQQVEFNAVVQGVRRIIERVIRESIHVDFDLCPEALPVLADRTQLEQVLLNLATNARDAMLQGGELLVRTRPVELDAATIRRHPDIAPGRYLQLSVADSGSGIPPEILDRIFDPFFTTKEVGRGTGLGLSICFSIVKQHHGFIDVETESGRGATFLVYLPLTAGPSAAAREADKVSSAPRGNETVLLAEDDPAVRLSNRLLLEEFGYRVVEARDGIEVLEILDRRARDIGLVVSDVVMPRMGGMQVRREIERRWPQMPMLFISGYTFGEADDELDVLEKPVRPLELLNRIRDLLDG